MDQPQVTKSENCFKKLLTSLMLAVIPTKISF